MPTEFIVRVVLMAPQEGDRPAPGAREGATQEYRFSKLPISIGRAPENDIAISNHFVSNAHVRIEEIAGKICLRDLGSRNGVQVLNGTETVRIAARAAYEVSRTGFEFCLGSQVRLRVEPGGPATAGPSLDLEHRASARPAFGTSAPPDLSGLGDGLPPLPQLARPLRNLPPLDPRAGGAASPDAGDMSLLPKQGNVWAQDTPSPPLRRSTPAPEFEPVKPGFGPSPDRIGRGQAQELKTGTFDLSLEVLALQGLREIVGSLTPGRGLDTQGDVARLITRVHTTLEVLCRCFLALRDGHAKFVSGLHLQRSALYDPARVALDTARDPTALAGRLLDFREGATDTGQALEAALTELSLHQVALLDGLMQGIRALLEELSPEAITHDVENKRGAPRLGRGDRALWEEYCARYARFADEGEAFARVFGDEFTSAYRNYRRGRGGR